MTSRWFRSGHTPLSIDAGGCPVPPAPSNIVISNVTTSGFRVSWDAVPNAFEYYIDLNVGPTQVVPAPDTHFDFTGMTPGTEYCVQMLVSTECNYSVLSIPAVCATTSQLPGLVWAKTGESNEPTTTFRRVFSLAEGSDRLVACANTRVLVSTNGGLTWTNYTPTPRIHFVAYANGRFVGISGESTGLWYSTDGITWVQSNVTGGILTQVAWVPWANEFLATLYNGNTYWSPTGVTWTQSGSTGVSGTYDIFVAPDHVVVNHGSSIARRSSVKNTWTTVTGLDNTRWKFCWAGAYGWRGVDTQYSEGGLYGSTNGNAFANVGSAPSSAAWKGIAYDPASNTLMVWRAGAVYTSRNGGATWSAVATGTMPTNNTSDAYFLYGSLWAPIAGRFIIGCDAITVSPPT